MASFFRFVDKKRFNVNSAIFQEQVNFQWDDDDVRYLLEQHALLHFYSASSMKQQIVDRQVASLRHIILIPSQPAIALYM